MRQVKKTPLKAQSGTQEKTGHGVQSLLRVKKHKKKRERPCWLNRLGKGREEGHVRTLHRHPEERDSQRGRRRKSLRLCTCKAGEGKKNGKKGIDLEITAGNMGDEKRRGL